MSGQLKPALKKPSKLQSGSSLSQSSQKTQGQSQSQSQIGHNSKAKKVSKDEEEEKIEAGASEEVLRDQAKGAEHLQLRSEERNQFKV